MDSALTAYKFGDNLLGTVHVMFDNKGRTVCVNDKTTGESVVRRFVDKPGKHNLIEYESDIQTSIANLI